MFGLGKNRGPVSYIDTHNAAVIRYRRYCRAFVWVGIVNFIGLLVGIIQYYIQSQTDKVPFYYCFGVSDFLFNMLAYAKGLPTFIFWVIVFFFTVLTTAGAVVLGLFASFGRKKFLFAMVGAYFLDWIFTFLAFFVAGEDTIGLMINAGIHVVATFFVIMSVYQYYAVLNVEKRFKNIPTVAETKQKEMEEKQVEETKDGD